MAGLRIGVNALYLIPGGVGGTEIYLRNLLAALARIDSANEYVVFTNRETGGDLAPGAPNFTHAPQPVNAVNRPARIVHEQLRLPVELKRRRIDCLFNPGFTAPLAAPCASVTVFHDLQHKRRPELFRPADLLAWRFLLYWSAKRSRAIVAVSEATAADVHAYYGVPRERIHVVGHGVEPEFFAMARPGRSHEPMALYVSTLHPHKNTARLLEAFARFHQAQPAYRLVLAGLRGFYADRVDGIVQRLGLRDAVEVTGWIARDRLLDLYRRAEFAVYPSEFEGFGMPVLEALAAGLPVACSDIAPLRELAGDAALFFPPRDTRAMGEALLRMAGDAGERARLSAAGRLRAAGRTWERTARETLAVIEAACTQHAPD